MGNLAWKKAKYVEGLVAGVWNKNLEEGRSCKGQD